MKRLSVAVLTLMFFGAPAFAAGEPNGLIQVQSRHNVSGTVLRLKQFLRKKHIPLFALIDHSKAARQAGLELRPTELLIFGNPKLGSKLMEAAQPVGLDLPLKALVWQDAAGHVWITYDDPRYLAGRYGIPPSNPIITKMTGLLAALAGSAAGPSTSHR